MSEAHQRRRAAIAEGMRRLNDESIQRGAQATPGERIEQAIQLSDLLLRSATVIDKPLPPSLPALYRARRRP